ncbi:MAG: small multi-drug export protein [Spirochaetes bacterium]|nr:small multi-drug export protein [Spirochaetota bacterium]
MIILSMLPVIELRGSIPYGYFNGINIFIAFFLSVIFNSCASLILFIFLEFFNHLFLKIPLYKKFFDKISERSLKKVKPKFEKYEYIGLMIFVAIPLPATGAITGTIGAWLLRLDIKKSFFFISLGVLIAGIIVSIITIYGGIFAKLFIKTSF